MRVRNPPGLKLILYVDFMSQPSQALIAFCRMNGIKHEIRKVSVLKAEFKSKEFTKINPARQVPAIQEVRVEDGHVEFTMSESHAIMRYLAVSRNCPDNWYPADLEKRAIVNNYLDEHHNFLRQGLGVYVFKKLFSPMINNYTYTEEELEWNKDRLERGLALMEARL